MNDYQPSENLKSLVNQMLSGDADPEQTSALDSILRSDEDARQWYLREIQMHGALVRWAANQSATGSHGSSPYVENILHLQRRRSVYTTLIATAAILIIGLITMRLILSTPDDESFTSFRAAPDSQYTLTHSSDSDAPSDKNVLLEGSRLQINKGTVELTFPSGVTAIIQSPANFTYMNEELIQLDQGSVWCQVPPKASGFTILTPEYEVVDLGTEFGIISSPGQPDQVHVFDGEVEVTHLTTGKKRRLTANQAVEAKEGKSHSIDANLSSFFVKLPTFSGTLDLKLNDKKNEVTCSTAPLLYTYNDYMSVDNKWGYTNTSGQSEAVKSGEVWVSRQDLGEDPPLLTVSLNGLSPGRTYEVLMYRPMSKISEKTTKTLRFGEILAGVDPKNLTLRTRENSKPVSGASALESPEYIEMQCVVGVVEANRFGNIKVYIDNSNRKKSRSYISGIGVRAK